jgi:DNA-binding MarR family transcriptional regulator
VSIDHDSDGNPRLASLLRLASQSLGNRLARWIVESGFDGIQPAHSAVIQPLWASPGGERVTSLARASRITKQSMSSMVSDLEKLGYVERTPDPSDARAYRVRLTRRGRTYGRAVRAFSRQIEEEWESHVGAKRMAALVETLEVLRKADFLSVD